MTYEYCSMYVILFTFFLSDYGYRVGGYAPSCIGCCYSDGVATVLLQSSYGVAGRATSGDGTTSSTISLPHHLIAVHH